MPGHEIYHQRAESTSLTYTGGELKIRETDNSSGYSVRLLKDSKIGFAYCQSKEELPRALEQAERISRFSVESQFVFPPEADYKGLEISNPEFDPSDYKTLHSLVSEAREAAESHGGKSRVIAELGAMRTELENTSGFKGEYDKTEISLYAECMDADGFGLSYSVQSIKMPDARALGMRAAEMAKQMQGAKKPKSGTYMVVTELEVLESLIETLLPSFSGDWKRRGISRLELGERMFSEDLTISDDPLGDGSEARPFDDEGTVASKRHLVKGGTVDSFLYDRENAALEGVDESGACSRSSYVNPPGIGGSNITVSPGDWNSLGELDRYLEVHNVHGSHTANPTTGDTGLEVSTAFMVEKGKRTPVKGFMITANVFDLFDSIEGIEKQTRTLDYLTAPRIAFRDVRVVA